MMAKGIGESCVRDVATVDRATSVAGVAVVDAAGGLVGIVAVDDVLRALAAPLTALADLATREIRYEAATRR